MEAHQYLVFKAQRAFKVEVVIFLSCFLAGLRFRYILDIDGIILRISSCARLVKDGAGIEGE
jgi:hypothetical protein